jgi:NAD(P)H-flavin reductase
MRTLAPFGRRLARVAAVERIGEYVLLWAEDPHGPSNPRPGQFYMVAADAGGGAGADERPWLPRAFSFCRVEAGRIGFIVEDVGPGTHRLAELAPGDGLWLTGPLGIGFAPPEAGRPLLVGGGIGVAPILCWSDELGPNAEVLLGFRSGGHAAAASLFRGDVALATDDGSAGREAYVTEMLREELDADAAATVYACGPPPMLEAVRALCGERGVSAQLAMESGMACGFGACFGCVVPTRDGYVRLCVDGPVVDAGQLDTALVPGSGH